MVVERSSIHRAGRTRKMVEVVAGLEAMSTPAPVDGMAIRSLTRPKRSLRQSETERRVAIYEWLTRMGAYGWRQKNDASYSERAGKYIPPAGSRDYVRGLADLGFILPGGIALQIETKSEHGRPTPQQTEHLERVRKLGGVAFVARDVRDVERNLAAVGWIVINGRLVRSKGEN